jgi:hypothetical protein
MEPTDEQPELQCNGQGERDWGQGDLDEYGTYATPHFAHSQMYYVRDVSKRWCEEACARNDTQQALHCAKRFERARLVLLDWHCTGCAICPAAAAAHVLEQQPAPRALSPRSPP